MSKSLFTSRGETIQLGRELGRGGEGSVFELASNPNQVAKIYHQTPDLKKQDKLRYMSTVANDTLLTYAAWPQETLHSLRGGSVTGILMPKVTSKAPIHMLYSPAHRRQEYPRAAWNFLLYAARNTAAAFSTLHESGHIIGDVNQGNIMVGADSKVMLIDCDSFQVSARGSLHFCEVGVSHFTPPELQGLSSFNGVQRTANHDNFGLALVIFHLLFGGRHPYSGVPLRKDVGESLETDIKAFRFSYARDAKVRGVSPPPNSIPTSLIPNGMMAMFETAFTEAGNKSGRPTAQQWVASLDALKSQLKKCASTQMHIFPDHLDHCPWCLLNNSGIVYFIDLGSDFTAPERNLVIKDIWKELEKIAHPAIVNIPSASSFSVTPTPLPSGVSSKNQLTAYKLALSGLAILIFFANPKLWILIGLGTWLAWGSIDSMGGPERKAEYDKRKSALKAAQDEFNLISSRLKKEAGPEGFTELKQELMRQLNEYQGLGTAQKDEIEKLHATAESRQKHKFLDGFFIDSASISGVGPAKKAALRSFGIETAADVSWDKVIRVRGFGEVLTRAVVDWKKHHERRFVFNPRTAVTEADRNAVRAKYATRRAALEASLIAGPANLQKFKKEAVTKISLLRPQMEAATKKLAQAQADISLI